MQQREHQSEGDEMNTPIAPVSSSLLSRRMCDTTTPLDDGVHAYRAHFSCRYLGKVKAKSKRLITWYVVFFLWKSFPLQFIIFLALFAVTCVWWPLHSGRQRRISPWSRLSSHFVTMIVTTSHARRRPPKTQARRRHFRKSLRQYPVNVFLGAVMCEVLHSGTAKKRRSSWSTPTTHAVLWLFRQPLSCRF